MILRRLGNKKKLAKEIQKYFPVHSIYIEPFFGAGGMFFNKPKAKYNIVNDLDSDVFNLFQVVMDRKEELKEAFYLMPIHSDLLEYWKKHKEEEPIKKALRFLLLSNCTYLGKGDTIHYSLRGNDSLIFEKKIDITFSKLKSLKFNNTDFRKFLTSFNFKDRDFGKESKEREFTFIYSDPTYKRTTDTYSTS